MLSNVLIKRSLIISVGLLAIIAGYLLAAENRVSEEINVDCVGEVHRAGVGLKYDNYQFSYKFKRFRWFVRLFGREGVGYAQSQNYDSILIPRLKYFDGFRVILLKNENDQEVGQFYGLIKRIEYRWAGDHAYIGICKPSAPLSLSNKASNKMIKTAGN